jgi:hypothetical protein
MCKDIGSCCGGDSDDCVPTTVEGDLVREACQDVIDVVNVIRELADEDGDEYLVDRCASLMILVGELTQVVVAYADPDPGIEPF